MSQEKLIEYLSGFITPKRFETYQRVLLNRTRYITIVLEDIYQPHNASAVLRSCECTGIQDVHVIENQNQYRVNPDVVLGSSQWLNLYKHNDNKNNTLSAISSLKTEGYRIVATTPNPESTSLENLHLESGKIALLFGTELTGLTQEAMELSDEFLTIPMVGFTDSYNISVSAALVLYTLTKKLRASSIDWKLSEQEREKVMVKWITQSIKKSDAILEAFEKREDL